MIQKMVANGKTRITIRIDDDILEWFRAEVTAAGGGNYQTLLNRALREYIQERDRSLEEIVRRVVREELIAARTTPVNFKSNTSLSR
jgi:hypothetical protein